MENAKKRLKNQLGESLIETLAALLIACLGLALLPGAIVASARVNKKASEADYVYTNVDRTDVNKSTSAEMTGSITISGDGKSSAIDATKVKIYQDTSGKNTYYYYKYTK